MNINQAFTILNKAGDIRAARIITENKKKFNFFSVHFMAYQLRHNVPVAKIIHKKWFYGLDFYTNFKTLDPRPDTETLVQAVINDYKNTLNLNILDIGTGSGCIICAICKNIPTASGIAIDKSHGALHVAKKNIKKFGLSDKIKIKHDDFTHHMNTQEKFDVIVSNPPYIAFGDKRVNNCAKHDPKIALYTQDNGYYAYSQIAKNSATLLKPNGKIYLEIGIGMSKRVKQIFVQHDWMFVGCVPDLSGKIRVLVFSRQNPIPNHQNRYALPQKL